MKHIFRIAAALGISFLLLCNVLQSSAQPGFCDLQLMFVVDTSLVGGNDAVYRNISSNVVSLLHYISEYQWHMLPEARISYALAIAEPDVIRPVSLIPPITTQEYWIDLQQYARTSNLATILPRVYEQVRAELQFALQGSPEFPSLAKMSSALPSLGNRMPLPPNARRALFYIGTGKMQEDFSSDFWRQWDSLTQQSHFSNLFFLGTANDIGSIRYNWLQMVSPRGGVTIPDIHVGVTPNGTNRDDLIASRFLFLHGLHYFETLIADACGQNAVIRVPQENLTPEWKFQVGDGQAVLRVATAYDPTLTNPVNTIRLFAPDGREITPQIAPAVVRRFDGDPNLLIWEIINPPPGEWRAQRLAQDFYNDQNTSVWGWQFLHVRTLPYASPGHAAAVMQTGAGQVFFQPASLQPMIFRHQRMNILLAFNDGDPRLNPVDGRFYNWSRVAVELCTLNCFPVPGAQITDVSTSQLPKVFQVSFPVSVVPPAAVLTDIRIEVFIGAPSPSPNQERSIGKFTVQHLSNTPSLLQIAEVGFVTVPQFCRWDGSTVQGGVLIYAAEPAFADFVSQVDWQKEVNSRAQLYDLVGPLNADPIAPNLAQPNMRTDIGTGYFLYWQIAGVNSTGPLTLIFEFSYPNVSAPFNNTLNCSYPSPAADSTE